ncbi:MAG: HD domain-containing protein [Acidimicrobiia bacterium]
MSARAQGQRVAHLVRRYVESLRARPLDHQTRRWAADALEPEELAVWENMGLVDQVEGIAVARRLNVALAGTSEASDPRWRAAALLHDAGKQASGYGTVGRTAVTMAATLMGTSRLRGWVDAPGPIQARMGRYVAHDELGAALLREAGARPEVAAWAGAHHRPARWNATAIPLPVCRALAAADGEPPAPARAGTPGRAPD